MNVRWCLKLEVQWSSIIPTVVKRNPCDLWKLVLFISVFACTHWLVVCRWWLHSILGMWLQTTLVLQSCIYSSERTDLLLYLVKTSVNFACHDTTCNENSFHNERYYLHCKHNVWIFRAFFLILHSTNNKRIYFVSDTHSYPDTHPPEHTTWCVHLKRNFKICIDTHLSRECISFSISKISIKFIETTD